MRLLIGKGSIAFLLVVLVALALPGLAMSAKPLTPEQEALFRAGAQTVGGLTAAEVEYVLQHPESVAGIPVVVEHRTTLTRASAALGFDALATTSAGGSAGPLAVAGATAWDITYYKDVYGALVFEFLVKTYYEFDRTAKRIIRVNSAVVQVATGVGVSYKGIISKTDQWRTHQNVKSGLYYRYRKGQFTYLATPWGTVKHYYPCVELYMPYTGYWWSYAGY